MGIRIEVAMRRSIYGLWLEPCPFCGEDTHFDGKRRYWPPNDDDGLMRLHECMLKLEPITEHSKPAAVKQIERRGGGIDL